MLHNDWRKEVFAVIGNLINESGCRTILVNGVPDHVHGQISLKPVVSISELMKTVKAKSSKYINDQQLTPERFEWQRGYGVFSYSHSQIASVYQYIQNQEKHHATQTFQDEYRSLLEKFQIEFNEAYGFQNLMDS